MMIIFLDGFQLGSVPVFMLDEHAGILDDVQTGGLGFLGGRLIGYAELHPHGSGPDIDGLIDKGRHIFAALKKEDEVDRFRYFFQSRIRRIAAQPLGHIGVNSIDRVTLTLQICGDVITGFLRV